MRRSIYKVIMLFTKITLIILSLSLSVKSYSQTFTLPSNGDDIVGKVQWTQSLPGDNFSILGRRYDVGYYQLVEANPGVDPSLPHPGTVIVVPTQYIIPHVPHVGVVLNLAELRVYYFPSGTNKVVTYPVGVGREGWDTPLGVTTIVAKVVNPTWVPTENIRKWRASQGVNLPPKILPGPDNPLGGYALHLGFPDIRMHGTNDPSGIGRRSSSGCIRMWPEDIEEVFSFVKTGTTVRVINDPYKAGWLKNKVYLESHTPLEEQQDIYEKDLSPMTFDIQAIIANRPANIDWDKAKSIAENQNGIAQIVGQAKT
jgi:L,D-transpeptidase ErfK/SrfK